MGMVAPVAKPPPPPEGVFRDPHEDVLYCYRCHWCICVEGREKADVDQSKRDHIATKRSADRDCRKDDVHRLPRRQAIRSWVETSAWSKRTDYAAFI